MPSCFSLRELFDSSSSAGSTDRTGPDWLLGPQKNLFDVMSAASAQEAASKDEDNLFEPSSNSVTTSAEASEGRRDVEDIITYKN